MKTIILCFSFFIAVNVFSQSITNTLGTNGVFTIKDASNNYLTLSQSSGQLSLLKTLRLENTTGSSVGVVFIDTNRFLHNFGSGYSNTFLGARAGNFSMTSANNNTGIGASALLNLTTGVYNAAVGVGSLLSTTTGYENTAIGTFSMVFNTTGFRNTALGHNSLSSNTNGNHNTAIGHNALLNNTTGVENIAVGNYSLDSNIGGNYNSALGFESLKGNTNGSKLTAIGHNSLRYNSTGIENTALGYSTGTLVTTGGNLTLIGYNAEPTSGTAINQITLGNNQVTSLRCNVTTITSLSDARDKKNIKDLNLGLDFLMKIKPRLFNWDKREWYENNISDGSKMTEAPTAGFIAQELDEVQTNENAQWLNLVLKDNPEELEATSGNLLPVMVKAIQELKEENDLLKERLSKFEQLVNDLTFNEALNNTKQTISNLKRGEEK